jgi:hypothetical protein
MDQGNRSGLLIRIDRKGGSRCLNHRFVILLFT